jgi:AraC family transcriptional regulator of adaptative response / DNA-3-methyladenine glycosylase II
MAAASGTPLTARALESRAEAWRPWRGYAVLHLWRSAGDDAVRPKRVARPARPAAPSKALDVREA